MPFAWQTEIAATPSGLSFVIFGQASKLIETRRTGLCVLHPIPAFRRSVVGVRHTDGSESTTVFPDLVLPGAPFENLEQLTFREVDGLPEEEVNVRFHGDEFSTEDQRNWTDASLKTYCHPQSRGQVYEIGAGEMIRHEVIVSFGKSLSVRQRIGTWSDMPDALTHADAAAMAAHDLTHVAYRLSRSGYSKCRALAIASHLYVAAQTPVPTEPWEDAGPGDLLVVQGEDWLREADALAEWRKWAAQRHLPVVLATAANFVGMNRNRPPVGPREAVGFAMDAAVHSRDDRSILETPQGLADCVRTAMTFGGNGEVVVGPISFAADGRVELLRRFVAELRKCATPETLFTVFTWDGENREAWQVDP